MSTALARAGNVFKGALGVVLIDEVGFYPYFVSLDKIEDDPRQIIEVLNFDCYAPGAANVVLSFNRAAPHPDHLRDSDRRLLIDLRNHLRLESSKHGKGQTPGLRSDGTNGPADAHALILSLLPVSEPLATA
jgi:hypothetical protein